MSIRLYKSVNVENGKYISVCSKKIFKTEYPINSEVEAPEYSLKKGYGLLVCKDFFEAQKQGGTHILLCSGYSENEMELPKFRLDINVFIEDLNFQKRLFSLLSGNTKNTQFLHNIRTTNIIEHWPYGTSMFKKISVEKLLIKREYLFIQ